MKLIYAVVFEQTPNNYCAYIPDLPGCIATHKTWDGIQAMIKEAMVLHIEVSHEYGDPIPPPQMSVEQALEYHRSQPNDYGGYFPAPEPDYDDEPAAVLEVEVEVNLETAPTTAN
ncbi:MAG: type II toxin-antitoxin system HicB family antitoxin [Chloroflexota bacterium]|nr:type II toxin-antitoxin system HicB family antitoxin [Chloroflexota bacterium]MDE2961092.1 type II toxin-antitoxin system HicB family antitoxin [Chloroflexota bacterium]